MADVLIIDDDEAVCDVLSQMMKNIGHDVRYALNAKDGIKMASEGGFDLVLLDVNLPDANGLEIIPSIKSAVSSPEIIIITGENDPNGAEMAINSGAWDYLEKPFFIGDLNLQVSRALQFRKERGTICIPGALKRDAFIGSSFRIRESLEQVTPAVMSEDPVLFVGEGGTGKKMLASILHLNSSRANEDFAVVDCAAVNSAAALEKYLFGDMRQKGLLKKNNPGVIFFRHIHRLEKKAGQMLVEFIEKFHQGNQEYPNIKTNGFRILASTISPLDASSVFTTIFDQFVIELPPLRARKGDSVKLALHYVDLLCKKYKIPPKGVSPEFVEIVDSYKWPGNVRELVAAVTKAVGSAKGEPTLYSIHLPTYVKTHIIQDLMESKSIRKSKAAEPIRSSFPPLKAFIETSEKQYLMTILSQSGGNVKDACKIAGISSTSMYARLKKYNLT